MTWATFLLSLVGPIAKRVLVALGLSVVTYAGVSAGFSAIEGYAKSQLAGLPADVLAIAALSGIFPALGIVAGAYAAALAAQPLKRILPD